MFPFLAPLLLIAAHVCPTPRVAYHTDRTLTRAEYRQLERYGACVCGPEGYNDFSISPGVNYEVYRDQRERRYRFHPSCERSGWIGNRYRGDR